MRKGVVSVVLPIYNVEKYLNRCVKSVVNQSYKNLEIILVDDGSPDNCPTLCEDWAKKDSRIKVVHKKNAGLGYARNTGIENATGEYICFFDSDDYIALDAIEKAYSLAVKEKSDIVVFGICDVKSNGETGKTVIPKTEKVTYSGNEVQNVFLADLIGPDVKNGTQTNLWMSAWASMYSLDMIRKASWKFVSEREIISEDIYSLLDCIVYVPTKTLIDEQYPWMISIGNHVRITEGVKILTHDYSWSVLKNYRGGVFGASGIVEIGDNVFIGMNAIIERNVKIGNNVVIGAGSIVTKDCEENSVYAGVPAKRIMNIDEFLMKRRDKQLDEAKLQDTMSDTVKCRNQRCSMNILCYLKQVNLLQTTLSLKKRFDLEIVRNKHFYI